jgi:hypothetical protein
MFFPSRIIRGAMSFYKAKEIFDDAKQYINPGTDPVMWDLINGLAEMSQALNQLRNDVDDLKRKLQ